VSEQTTLLTCHKGVDLHAATAAGVMRERLADGRRLVALHRAEYFTFWGRDEAGLSVDALLAVGRHFNPNKHFFGHFLLREGGAAWFTTDCRGESLPAGWPGEPLRTDLGPVRPDLGDRLLGGVPADDLVAVDVCTFPLGERGPLLGGVLWRLVLRTDRDPLAVADRLVVTRGGDLGLLVNPHMQGWLIAVRKTSHVSEAN